MTLRTLGMVLTGLLLLLLCTVASVSAEVAGTERITFTGYSVDDSVTVSSGTTLKIPVTVSGYPRGLNQYSIEFAARSSEDLSLGDFGVTLDKTMIQHSASSTPVESDTGIERRYLQTVKIAAYPDYGVNETGVGTLTVNLPASSTSYDVVLSARIVESTSGSPLASLATPSTGEITLHVTAEKPATKKSTSSSPSPLLGLLLAGAGALCFRWRNNR